MASSRSSARAPRRVVLVNQAFHPDVVATAQIAKDLADALVGQGMHVTALASRSIYGQSGATLPPRETIDGIEVVRVGSAVFGKSSLPGRALDYGMFWAAGGARLLASLRPDVVISLTTPPFVGLLGLAARGLRGAKAISWIMDLYPDVAVALGALPADALVTRGLERLGTALLGAADVNVVLGRCMEERVLAKGIARDKVVRIPVWSSEVDVRPIEHEDNPSRPRFGALGDLVVMYSGNLGLGHDVATLCAAMERLRDEPTIRFVFVGGGRRRPEVEAFVRQRALSNVAFFGYEPRERLAESLSAADVHLVTLSPEALGLMVPSKLFGALAAGRPTVFVGPAGSEVARVLAEHAAGLRVEPGDVEGLVAALRRLARDAVVRRRMGDAARSAFLGRFDRGTLCQRWVELIDRVAPSGA